MAVTRTQTATIKTGTAIASLASNSLTTVAGRSLFCAGSFGDPVATAWNTPTDSKGNTWVSAVVKVSGTLGVMIGWCLAPGTVGAGHTVTVSNNGAGAGDMCCAFCEYSGIPAGATVLSTNSNSGTGTAVTTGACNALDYVLTLIAENNAGAPTITPNAAWTQISENESGTSAQPLNFSEQIGKWGTLNGAWTLGTSQAWASVIAQIFVMQRMQLIEQLALGNGLRQAVRRASSY